MSASSLQASDDDSSIPIHVASEAYSPLLHGFKTNKAYGTMKEQVFDTDEQFATWAEDEDCQVLAAKLWQATGFKKIDPDKGLRKVLQGFQSIAQQINIERSHKMELLSNRANVLLTSKDELILRRVADYICRLRYCGLSLEDQRRMARLASGTLPATIVGAFDALRQAEERGGSMTIYSAHDNTIMAMLAHLGYKDFPIPSFAAHLCFELHEPIPGRYRVRVLYNPEPLHYGFPDDPDVTHGSKMAAGYFRLAGAGQRVAWEERELGDMAYDEFAFLLMEDRRSFKDEASWQAASEADPNGLDVEPVPLPTAEDTLIDASGVQRYALKPFPDQVAGHVNTIMQLGPSKICKPFDDQEHSVYLLAYGINGPLEIEQHHRESKAVLAYLDGHEAEIADVQRRLRRWLPKYYGTIFVQVDKSPESKTSEEAPTPRRYTVTIPRSYRAISRPPPPPQAILESTETLDDEEEKQEGESPVLTAAWAFMPSWMTDSGWEKRYVVFDKTSLLWFEAAVPDPTSSLAKGALALKKDGIQIVNPQDPRLARVTWPKSAGQGFAIVKRDETLLPVYFEDAGDCRIMYEALCRQFGELKQAVVDAASARSAAIGAIQQAAVALQEATEMLRVTDHGQQSSPVSKRSTFRKSSSLNRSRRVGRQPDASQAPRGKVYMVLENLLASFVAPCILDLKLGTRQHADNASPEKRAKQIAKCNSTTSASLGLRCSGMRKHVAGSDTVHIWDKTYGRTLTKDDFEERCLGLFLTRGDVVQAKVAHALKVKLTSMIADFKQLDNFRFYSCSLLLIYSAVEDANAVEVRLVDFARTISPGMTTFHSDRHEGVDQGMLLGLQTLEGMLTNLSA
eukprot:TRINITY_DN11109_c0_g2_i4.p1 TRINITY_DN11109_c0_g2~~TRINITY_DN11109_c0_g2_i4.p1  ORF type:complete len:941 (+),score=202.94 TRINITY_DN11109_c0_g2_i4:266-2824(+)